MTQSPTPADLVRKLSDRISTYVKGSGKVPLKLLRWALGELEECARNQSLPSAKVMEVVNAVIKDDPRHQLITSAANADRRSSAAVDKDVRNVVGAVASSRSAAKPLGVSGASCGPNGSGSSGGAGKGAVVFTPLYGCDETVGGVGPVCSILEVSGGWNGGPYQLE